MSNRTVSWQFTAGIFGAKARAIYLILCALAVTVMANAGEQSPPPIITFDAPGAGTAVGQGTGCFAYTDCSVVVNVWGAITGYYLDANNVFHGFVRSPDGKFTSFEAPDADTKAGDFNGTLPNAINDAGAITGVYYDVNNVGHGFLRSPEGAMTTFNVPDGSQLTNPIALNLEGAVVGFSLSKSGVFHGFLRRHDGTFETWIGPDACDATSATGCFGTGAFGINVWGTIAGAYEDNSGNFVDHGLLRSPWGAFTSFEAPGSGTGTYQGTGCPGCSVALNQFGAVASYYIDDNNVVHGFLRNPDGVITTFNAPPGAGSYGLNCYNDCSVGLNDEGTITGYYLDANNVYHGFVRSPDGMMTTFDAPGADTTPNDYNGTFPVSINDQGAIAGYYLDSSNVAHGFLRLPGK